MYLELDEALSSTSLERKVPLSSLQNPAGAHCPGSREDDVKVATQDFQQTPKGQQGAGLLTHGWQGAPCWSLVVVGRGGIFSEPSWSRCSRVPSPCSCSSSFLFSSLCSLTLRSVGLPVPSAWRWTATEGPGHWRGPPLPWELPGLEVGVGKEGCSGRVRLWDSPAQCKVPGVLRSCQQPGCEQGLSMKRKPAGEAGPLVKPGC